MNTLPVRRVLAVTLLCTQCAAFGAEIQVEFDGGRLKPENVAISEGDVVVWEATDQFQHDTRSFTGEWKSPRLSPGESFSFRFTSPGLYVYDAGWFSGSMVLPYAPGTVSVVKLQNDTASVSIVAPPD